MRARQHKTDRLAELVCSNSFAATNFDNAVGCLKDGDDSGSAPGHACGGRQPCPRAARRSPWIANGFSAWITDAIDRPSAHHRQSGTRSRRSRNRALPHPVIIATGPLARSDSLCRRDRESRRRRSSVFLRCDQPDRAGGVDRPVESGSTPRAGAAAWDRRCPARRCGPRRRLPETVR